MRNYSTHTQNMRAESGLKIVLKSYATIVATNGIVVVAIVLVSTNFLIPWLEWNFSNNFLMNIVSLVLPLAASAPFLWALMVKKPDSMTYKEMWIDRKYNRGPLVVIEILRNLIGVLLIAFLVEKLFSTVIALVVAVPVIFVVLYIFSRRIQAFYRHLEGSFLTNLNAREQQAKDDTSLSADVFKTNESLQPALIPWDAHIVDLEVGRHAEFIGKPLKDLMWRENYGINIVYIKRGEKLIHAPSRDHFLLPFDHVGIIATDDQIHVFKNVFEAVYEDGIVNPDLNEIVLQTIVVDENTRLKGKTIRESGIRENAKGLIVGIERKGQRILNPDSNTVFEWDDIVWIVGDRKKIRQLSERKVESKVEDKATPGS